MWRAASGRHRRDQTINDNFICFDNKQKTVSPRNALLVTSNYLECASVDFFVHTQCFQLTFSIELFVQ